MVSSLGCMLAAFELGREGPIRGHLGAAGTELSKAPALVHSGELAVFLLGSTNLFTLVGDLIWGCCAPQKLILIDNSIGRA